MNLYRYVGNNPVNWIDPYGLFWPLDVVKCFYYMPQCARKGLACKEQKQKECNDNPDDPDKALTDSKLFKECYQAIPECQKQIESCGSFALAPKGIPSPPNSTIPSVPSK